MVSEKVSESVSEKFGTEKSTSISIENIWYRKKVSVSVSFNIFGTVTHWSGDGLAIMIQTKLDATNHLVGLESQNELSKISLFVCSWLMKITRYAFFQK